MTDSRPAPPDWPTCQVDNDCIGVQLDAGDRGCVHDTTDQDARERWWDNLREGGTLDARGLTFTRAQLEELLDAVPRNERDRPLLASSTFERATFKAVTTRFEGATFEGAAVFKGATFKGEARFRGATFKDTARFGGVTFGSLTRFEETTFERCAAFEGATFQDLTAFEGALFEGEALFVAASFEERAFFKGASFKQARFNTALFADHALFDRVSFDGEALFVAALFEEVASFEEALFAGDAVFVATSFAGRAEFMRASFAGRAEFDTASFADDTFLGPMLVGDAISLAGATCSSRLDLEVATPRLNCTRSRIAGGGHLRVGWASVDLTEAEIPEPCILEDGAAALRARHELWERLGSEPLPEEDSWTVDLRSLRRATVTGLALSAVDLGDCRFDGAHDLERLRIPHTAQLHQAPAPARRQVLAEEIVWRQAQGAKRWQQLQVAEVADLSTGKGSGLEPIDVAELYRQLRRGRESRGDQPGAADFYYGEMEMRRKSPSVSWVERRILDAYWLLSGYALRATRPLIAIAVVLAVSMLSLTTGLIDSLTVSQAFWTSLGSVILRAPTETDDLPDQARNLTTVLRIVGPILLALAVLAIRGRVKR